MKKSLYSIVIASVFMLGLVFATSDALALNGLAATQIEKNFFGALVLKADPYQGDILAIGGPGLGVNPDSAGVHRSPHRISAFDEKLTTDTFVVKVRVYFDPGIGLSHIANL